MAVSDPSDQRTAGGASHAGGAGVAAPSLVADGREHRLHPGSVTAERLGSAIAGAILALMLVVPATVGMLMTGPRPLRLLIPPAWVAVAAFLAVRALWWPAVRYRHTAWCLNQREMRIRRGVLWRSVTSVPRSRVQHTDVDQGPIERAFELATLVIYTAGTQHSSVSLSGLGHATALAIRDHLIEGGDPRDDAV